MPISVEVRKEGGEVVREGGQPFRIAVGSLDADDFPMLWGIDRYGDTIFNRRQVRLLQAEMRRLVERSPESDELASIEEISGLCEEALARPHRYLWFRGD